jgi:hypothetical protein
MVEEKLTSHRRFASGRFQLDHGLAWAWSRGPAAATNVTSRVGDSVGVELQLHHMAE